MINWSLFDYYFRCQIDLNLDFTGFTINYMKWTSLMKTPFSSSPTGDILKLLFLRRFYWCTIMWENVQIVIVMHLVWEHWWNAKIVVVLIVVVVPVMAMGVVVHFVEVTSLSPSDWRDLISYESSIGNIIQLLFVHQTTLEIQREVSGFLRPPTSFILCHTQLQINSLQ